MNIRKQTNLLVSPEDRVVERHPCRKRDTLPDFTALRVAYKHLYSPQGRKEKGLEKGLANVSAAIFGRSK